MKYLKKKKDLQERKEWFEKWKCSTEERISDWKVTLGERFQTALDGSVESLGILEEYILSRYSDPMDVLLVENSQDVDALLTYLGEVMIGGLSDNPRWEVGTAAPEGRTLFYFHPYIKRGDGMTDLLIFNKLQFLVNKRSGDVLREYYLVAEEVNSESLEVSETSIVVNVDKVYSHQRFVWFREDITLIDLENKIKEFLVNYKFGVGYSYPKENELKVELEKFKYSFHFQLDDSTVVSDEAKEFAEEYSGRLTKEEVANCKQRIEFWGDEDKENRFSDFAEDFMYRIYDHYKVIVHDFTNGVFYGE